MPKPEGILPPELERRPAEHVVVTGLAQLSCLGDTEQTFNGLINGQSGISAFDVNNWSVSIAGPLPAEYQNLNEYYALDRKEQRAAVDVIAMGIGLAREAGRMAGILDENGRRINPNLKPTRVGICIGSGVGPTPHQIDVYRAIHGLTGKGDPVIAERQHIPLVVEADPKKNSELHLTPFDGSKTFPEEINGQTAIAMGIQGYPISSVEACATGLSNIYEGYRLIREGYADVVLCGAVDANLRISPEVPIGIFSRLGALAKGFNEDPEAASRPLDKQRSGFVLSDGGGIVVLESSEHAFARGAQDKILAEMAGGHKSLDAGDLTLANSDQVANTLAQACFDMKSGTMMNVDAYFGHLTGTPKGDLTEIAAFRKMMGEAATQVPVTAIKSMIGHSGGSAGAHTAVNGILSLNRGIIPPIRNLEEPDSEVADMNLVRGDALEQNIESVLVSAFGFGGHNAAALFKVFTPPEQDM